MVFPLSAEAGTGVRALAAKVNAAGVRDGTSLEKALGKFSLSDGRDSTLLRSISYGALRWHHRLQWQVEQLLARPIKARDAELAALLRIGLFQLQWLRIPDHAAVSATVAASARIGAGHAKGLVNAVLRRFLREREELDQRLAEDEEAQTSHPAWLIDYFKSEQPQHWAKVLQANNRLPPMWLRINRLRTSRADYLQALSVAEIAVALDSPTESAILLKEAQAMNTLPGFDAGLVAVQDAAAQLAPAYLALKPGLRVLDACAAPGGKSAHILETCPEIAELVVLDRDAKRLAAVQDSFSRLGHNATVIEGDAADPASWWDGQPFDRILLDAPCSALGVVRRHPDIKLLRRQDDIERVRVAQNRFLMALWPLLAPGGLLLYVTCTLLTVETTGQISAFLNATPDAEFAENPVGGSRQIWTGEANMDGFYYACLRKIRMK